MALSKTLKISIGAILCIAVLMVVAVSFLAIQLASGAFELAGSLPPETIGDWVDQLLKLIVQGD